MTKDVDVRTYPCCIVRVIDGDTIDVDVDHGFGVFTRQRIRLAGVDCPEIGTPGGRAAREAVLTWADFPLQTLVAYSKKDKYGRRIADLEMDGDRLSDELVKRGLAVRKEY